MHWASIARTWKQHGIERLAGRAKMTPGRIEELAMMYEPAWDKYGRLCSESGASTTGMAVVFGIDQKEGPVPQQSVQRF